jgi:Domain of unknown function (DUF4166)/Saccharopine dehydrogenase NADP binding domain
MIPSRVRVLILGCYGYFGGNLVRLLADEPRLTLIVAGRSLEKAQDFCRRCSTQAETIPAAIDRDGDVELALRTLAPDIVVDASGPFQSYGHSYAAHGTADPYHVIRASIAAGAHYLDLADASAFVAGVGTLDRAAKDKGVFALSGVSSFPVLTAAVVRRLSQDMAQIETITGGIAPSPYADVGLNVVKAIAGYAGQPVKLTRHGQPALGYGLTESLRFTICPPGRLPLRNTRFSLVDVPDLQVLPPLWPGLRTVWMGAGPVPEILLRALNGLAWLVRWRLLPSLQPLASLFHRVIGVLRWGEHRGGMFVRVEGRMPDRKPVARTWHLLAEGDDGPLIPSMACEAIIRHVLAGRPPEPGARPATGDIELADYEQLFARRTLYAGIREEPTDGRHAEGRHAEGRHAEEMSALPLYARVLGPAWSDVPEPIRRLHGIGNGLVAEGRATVERGRNPLARLIAAVFGFPKAGTDIPVSVRFDAARGTDGRPAERWTRTFAGKRFSSLQSEGAGRSQHLVDERFGPFTFGLAAVLDGDRLRIVPRRWSAFGIPMPRFLMPTGDSHERVEDGRFYFHVEIHLPLAGLIVRYQGHLTPVVVA